MKRAALLAMALAALAPTAQANDLEAAMRAYLENEIAGWASSDVIVSAITAQNQVTSGFDQAQIDAMDLAWRAEVGGSSTPTIDSVVNGSASDFLRAQVAESAGRMTEVFIMDARGLNVASSDVTSDYWQGDEEKFTETYGRGGGVHFGDVELDESTQRYQAQISFTVTDPATGQPIGAITVGVDAEALM